MDVPQVMLLEPKGLRLLGRAICLRLLAGCWGTFPLAIWSSSTKTKMPNNSVNVYARPEQQPNLEAKQYVQYHTKDFTLLLNTDYNKQ